MILNMRIAPSALPEMLIRRYHDKVYYSSLTLKIWRKNPMTRKQLKELFETTKKQVEEAIPFLCLTAFQLKIKPLVDRYNWKMDWGMGSVYFENRAGDILYDDELKSVQMASNELEEMVGKVIPRTTCGILWDVMSEIPDRYHQYNKIMGFK
jgi:hypothetical protein